MSIKTKFPTESALSAPVEAATNQILPVVKEIQPQLSAYRSFVLLEEYGTPLLFSFIFIGIFSLSGVLMPLVGYPQQRAFDGFFLSSLVIFVGVSVLSYLIIRHHTATGPTYYAVLTKFNDHFFSSVFEIFGVTSTPLFTTAQVTPKTSESMAEIQRLFRQSQLFSTYSMHTNYAKFKIHNPHMMQLSNRQLLICEVSASSDLLVTRHKLLQGYFVVYELPKELTGYTYIAMEQDIKNNGKNSFLNETDEFGFPDGIVPTETKLEWNEFEDFLRVVSSDHVEARYILTPDFMEDLYAWWKSVGKNVRMTFYGTHLYIYVPISPIRKNRLPRDLSKTTLIQEVHNAVRTLLYIFHLIEDITNQLGR